MWSRCGLCWVGIGLALLGGLGCAGRPELRLPDVRQTTDYTCSASALQAVLLYYGEEVGELELARELGATPADGAPPEAIVRVARAHGLTAELREQLRIDDLAQAVGRGIPVIVALQAWPNAPVADYHKDWEDGHYVVVIAVEREQLIFEDPTLLGSRGVLSRRDFLARWHDQDGRKRWLQAGIFLSGRPPRPPPPRQPID